ncbi:GspL family type II secretion system protein LspL [Methylosoma difficile]
MAEKILARKHPDRDGDYQWLMLSPHNRACQAGSLQQLAEAARDSEVILLVPASEVLHLLIQLPLQSSRQIAKALPYAIEDLLAQEVETYHLAWHKLADGYIAVAAIDQLQLHQLQNDCQQMGIHLSGLYSEALFVPEDGDNIHVVIENKHASLRFKQWLGGHIELDLLPLLVEKLIDEQQLPPHLQLWKTDPSTELAWSDSLSIEEHTYESALLLFAGQLGKKPALNLLSADYRYQAASQRPWLAWLPTAALLLLAAGVQLGADLQHYWQSQNQLQALETANQAQFHDAFPNLKRIVNMKAQAQQQLAELRQHAGQSHADGYLFLLYKAGEALNASTPEQALQIQSIDFTNNILNLGVSGSDVAQLEAFKQTLEQTPEIKADIRAAETGNKGLQAHIDISRPAS